MTDNRAAHILEIQHDIAELEADQPTATGRYARMIAERLPEARAELAALLGSGTLAELNAADQSTIAGNSQQAPSTPVAAQGVTGSGAAHVHDNTQIVGDVVHNYYGDKAPEKGSELLADYLDGLVRSCQELRLERVQHEAKDGNEQSNAPPLTLNEVFAQLTTTAAPRIVHERTGKIGYLRAKWPRFARRYGDEQLSSEYAAAQCVREHQLVRLRTSADIDSFTQDERDSEMPDDGDGRLRIVRPELAIDAIRDHRKIVLLGEPGSGKSTVLRWLAVQLALAAQGIAVSPLAPADATPPIPILLPLGQLDRLLADPHADPYQVLLQALATELDGGELTPGLSAHLRPALRRGGVILLLDGLDELPAIGAGAQSPRVRAAAGIRTLAQKLHARIVVTSRVVPYQQPGNWHLTDGQGWTLRTIAPLAFGQVRTFVGSWYDGLQRRGELTAEQTERASTDLIAQLESPRHAGTRAMLTTPLLLTMLTVLHYNDLRAGRDLPTERVVLYERCVELLLYRWEPVRTPSMTRKGLLELLEADKSIKPVAIRDLLNELAFCAHHRATDGSGRGRISRRELTGRLTEFFSNYGIAATGPIDRVERFCSYIASEVGLLQAEGDNQYVFPHLTFQEYLAACYVSEQLSEAAQRADDRITDPHLTVEDLLLRCWNGLDGERWRVLLLLMAERFGQGVTALLRDKGKPWIEQLAARDVAGVLKVPNVRRREAALAALSYSAVGGAAGLARTHRSLEALHGQLQTAIVDLLAVADARIPFQDRVAAAHLLNELPGGDPRPLFPERPGFWCHVSAGPFWSGNDQKDAPLEQVSLDYDFQISRFPMTNALYREFLDTQNGAYDPQAACWTEHGRTFLAPGGHRWDDEETFVTLPRLWHDTTFNQPNQPVVAVSWYEAAAFCRWLTTREHAAGRLDTGAIIRLPTSLEWEYAARGGDQHRYPWGDSEPTPEHANYDQTGIGRPSPVGCFPRGIATCGALDMAGNVMEWLATPDEKDRQVEAEKDFTQNTFVLLVDGTYHRSKKSLGCGVRDRYDPYFGNDNLGFRVLLSRARIV